MEYKSEQIVEITMSDIASTDEEDNSDAGDNKFDIHIEHLYTEPLGEEQQNNIIIKTENIKQETNNNEYEDTWSNQTRQLNTLKCEEEEIKDIIIHTENIKEEQFSIKHEFDEMDFMYDVDHIKETDDEEINVDQNDSKEEITHHDDASRLKHELEMDQDHQATTHLKNSISKNPKPKLRCKYCPYTTYQVYSFRKHSILHKDATEQIWYHCTKCCYKTMQKGHLRRHDAVHRPTSERTFFTCAICDYKFKQKCTLRRHIKDVHCIDKDPSKPIPLDQELYKCSQCTYSTYRRSLLVSHMDKHKDVQYICDICSFSTKYRRNLRVHLEIHGVIKDLQIYECNICKFQTRMGYCLKRHFLSKKHLAMVGKLNEYCPRPMKMKEVN